MCVCVRTCVCDENLVEPYCMYCILSNNRAVRFVFKSGNDV